jgi:hypothetical protein
VCALCAARSQQLDRLCYGWYLDYLCLDSQWYKVDGVKDSARPSFAKRWSIEVSRKEGDTCRPACFKACMLLTQAFLLGVKRQLYLLFPYAHLACVMRRLS